MAAAPRTPPHEEQRRPLAVGAASVAQSLPISSKQKKNHGPKQTFLLAKLSRANRCWVTLCPRLAHQFLGCGASREETGAGTDIWQWWRRGLAQFLRFEPPKTLVTPKSCSKESNVCSVYPLCPQTWATGRSLLREKKEFIVDTAPGELHRRRQTCDSSIWKHHTAETPPASAQPLCAVGQTTPT